MTDFCCLTWCKVYYASNVKINLPHVLEQINCKMLRIFSINATLMHNFIKKALDKDKNKGIIYLTIIPLCTGECHGCAKEQKKPGFTSAGISQPSSTTCDQQDVYRQRIFRSLRSCSGQVRDAALRPCRRSYGRPSRLNIWIFPGGFLPDKGGIRARRTARTGPQAPRAQTRPQNHRYGSQFYRQLHDRRQNSTIARIIKTGSKTVWLFGTSPQHRTRSIAATKKRAMNNPPIEFNDSCNEWTARYEQLRSTALSKYQSNGGNWGKALFIRHGMVGWMRAWPKEDTLPINNQPPPPIIPRTSIPSSLRNQITVLLANMILNGQREAAL